MNAERLFNVAGAIVTLATVTIVVTSPRTAAIVKAVTDGFSTSILAATRGYRS